MALYITQYTITKNTLKYYRSHDTADNQSTVNATEIFTAIFVSHKT